MKHLNVYFLQRIELMSAMVHRCTMESIHNYSPKSELQQRIMDREIQEHLNDPRLLAGLEFILTDLLDLLKNLGGALRVGFLKSFLIRADRRWTQLCRENTSTIQFSIRNYLAHGDNLLEVIVPELKDQILVVIFLKLFEDGKSLMAFMKMATDENMLQYMSRLEENGNVEFCINKLPENLKMNHLKDVEVFKSSSNWKQFMILLHGDEVETQNTEPDRDKILLILGDEIFERIQRSKCSSVISALAKIKQENTLQRLTDSMLKWTAFEMAAYFGNVQLCLELISNYGFNNENHPNALLYAAASGNEEVVHLFLKHQFPVHVRENVDGTNWGVLHQASNVNHQVSHICAKSVKLVEALIAAGADMNNAGVDEVRPVHLAAKHGFDCIVKLMARKGADLNPTETLEGKTPLHFAAEYGHTKVVCEILTHQANPFALSKSGHTPLDVAALKGHINVVRCLACEHSNFYSGQDDLIKSAISNAASAQHFDISDYLTSGIRADREPILFEAVHSDFERVKKLLLSGTNVNYCDSAGNSALHSICGSTWGDVSRNHVEVVKHLLISGAVAGSMNTKGQIPLHIAMTRPPSRYPRLEHRLKIIQLLIEFGARPSDVDNEGQTALHHAAANNCDEVVRFLASTKAADFTSKDFNGRTALHHSCLHAERDDLVCFKAVLAMSSEVLNEKDIDGKTPLHSAVYKGTEEVVKLLLDKGADVFAGHESKSALHGALVMRGVRSDGLVQLILDAMENDPRQTQFLNAKDIEGMTPLMKACQGLSTMVGKFLVQYGTDVNLTNDVQNDKTALHYAVRSSEIEMVEFLVEVEGIRIELKADTDSVLHEAVPNRNERVFYVILNKLKSMNSFPDKETWINLRSKNGNTPLMWAAGHGRLQIMRRLLKEGVDVNFKSPKGRTALHWAADKSKVSSILLLLDNKADVRISDESKLPLPLDLWIKYAGSQGVDAATIKEIESLLRTGLDDMTN